MEKVHSSKENRSLAETLPIIKTVAPYFKKFLEKLSTPKITLKAGEKNHPQMRRIN